MVEAVAQASAAEKPGQIGFGNIERIGDIVEIQSRNMRKQRWLALLGTLLLDEGFRVRSQIRFSESLIVAKSAFCVTD